MMESQSLIVTRVKANSNYCKIYYNNGTYKVVPKVLKWFEEQLQHLHYLRINRSNILNLNYVDKIEKHNSLFFIFQQEKLKASRRRTAHCMKRLKLVEASVTH